jgi:hypothetical protein
MTAPSDLLLNAFLRFYPDQKSGTSWLEDRARPKALLDAVLGSPLFAGIAVGRIGGDDYEPVTPAQAAEMVATGGNVLARFQDREDGDELMIDLDLRANRCEVRATATGAALAARGDQALDDLVTAMQACIAALRGVAGLGDGSIRVVSMSNAFDYPRPRPPRRSQRYPEGSVVTFLDPAFHASGASSAKPDEIAALTEPAPPSPADTTTGDGVVTVRWAKTIDRADLAAGASAHGLWIADRIKPDIDNDFNELGDQREHRAYNSQPTGGLTLYDPRTKVGYKAVLVLPDGSVEPSAWDDAKQIAQAGKLEDGTLVSAVRLVVPLRPHVFAIAKEAKQAGFDAVLYPEGDGSFWDPDPPGNWIGPPIQPADPTA